MSESENEERSEDVVLLTTVYSPSDAATLEAALTGYGVPYFCQGKAFGSLAIGTPQDLGGIRFYVPESAAEDAAALLDSFDQASS